MTVTLPTATTTVSTTSDWTTTLSAIRSKIGDVGGANGAGRVYLVDERINEIYANYPSVISASIECVKAILADIARDTDFTAGAISTSRTQVSTQFRDLLALLEQEQAGSITVFVGGSSYAHATSVNARTDVPRRVFRVGMDSNT